MKTGNRALNYLLSKHQPFDAKTKKAVDSIPTVAEGLFAVATSTAKDMIRDESVGFFKKMFPERAKIKALALSILDLQLTMVFAEFQEFTSNPAVASLLTDAVLFEATCLEAASPSETDLTIGSTKRIRGIHKFILAEQKRPHISDNDGWTFGKEYSDILFGNPMDIAVITGISTMAFAIRIHAKWAMKIALYGQMPTDEEKASLAKLLEEKKARMNEIVAQIHKNIQEIAEEK